jgi:hypothetical protein
VSHCACYDTASFITTGKKAALADDIEIFFQIRGVEPFSKCCDTIHAIGLLIAYWASNELSILLVVSITDDVIRGP